MTAGGTEIRDVKSDRDVNHIRVRIFVPNGAQSPYWAADHLMGNLLPVASAHWDLGKIWATRHGFMELISPTLKKAEARFLAILS
ncbi:hypothetical protein Q2941_38355 [Bradyrhizobium sp. UFLA05-153]